MKKFLKIILVVSVVLGLCALTCPDKERHTIALTRMFGKTLISQADKVVKDNDLPKEDLDEFKSSIASLTKNMEGIFDKSLQVKSYLFFSVGRMEDQDGSKFTTSVGLLGHVFTNKRNLAPSWGH